MIDTKTAIAASYAELYGEARIKIAKLEAELEEKDSILTAEVKRLAAKCDENQKLRDALKFYANESNWLDILDDVPAVFDDRGKIATKALEDEDG